MPDRPLAILPIVSDFESLRRKLFDCFHPRYNCIPPDCTKVQSLALDVTFLFLLLKYTEICAIKIFMIKEIYVCKFLKNLYHDTWFLLHHCCKATDTVPHHKVALLSAPPP